MGSEGTAPMRLAKTKAIAFSLRQEFVNTSRVNDMVDKGPRKVDWIQGLEQYYMCCEHVPLEEMESEDPGEIAEWFMKQSRKHDWQMRQMSPLGHLDIIAVGVKLYMIYDKLSDDVANYWEVPLKNSPNFTLITLTEGK